MVTGYSKKLDRGRAAMIGKDLMILFTVDPRTNTERAALALSREGVLLTSAVSLVQHGTDASVLTF